MDLQPGQIVDNKYRIIRLVGEGGMGSVFEGENTRILRRVAIKVLNPVASADSTTVMRFEREAQAAGHIGSDHILEVLDLGILADGSRYMVMEFLDGETLSKRIQRFGRLSGPQLYGIARQALIGLKAAHDAGIIHRDLKPDNLFVVHKHAGREDFVKIIDFGISKFNALSGDMSMTRTGAVMGTPYYMSPEQAKGAAVDARSDIYAIGVIMYEALTGRVPFDANTFNELMFKIVLSEPEPLTSACPDVEPRLAQIVMRAMARDVNQRFASSDELLSALDAWNSGAAPIAGHSAVPTVAAPLAQAGPGAELQNKPQFSTGGSWATSQTAVAFKPPSKVVPAVLGGFGLLIVAGVAFGAYKFVAARGAAEAGSATPAASAPMVVADVSAKPADAPAPEVAPLVESAAPPAPSSTPPAPSASLPEGERPQTQPSVASAEAKAALRPAPPPPRRGPAPAAPAKAKDRDFGY